MQQTDKYKLNKPGVDDPMAIGPLNENMDKVDAALAGHEQRVVSLENCRIVMGRYDSGQKLIDLGERPLAVLAMGRGSDYSYTGLVTGDSTVVSQNSIDLKIVDNGFQVGGYLSGGNVYYCYVAFLGGWATKDFPKPTT